jgi:hypothetical protein
VVTLAEAEVIRIRDRIRKLERYDGSRVRA